MSIHIYI